MALTIWSAFISYEKTTQLRAPNLRGVTLVCHCHTNYFIQNNWFTPFTPAIIHEYLKSVKVRNFWSTKVWKAVKPRTFSWAKSWCFRTFYVLHTINTNMWNYGNYIEIYGGILSWGDFTRGDNVIGVYLKMERIKWSKKSLYCTCTNRYQYRPNAIISCYHRWDTSGESKFWLPYIKSFTTLRDLAIHIFISSEPEILRDQHSHTFPKPSVKWYGSWWVTKVV